MSGSEIARQIGASISGVNDFLRAFKKCEDLQYPLPVGITNYGIANKVYGSAPGSGGRNENIELPDYEEAAKLMPTRKNMTLMFLWNGYKKKCEEEGARFYQYSQYCEFYNRWCEENYETVHFNAVIAQKMEVEFAGQTFLEKRNEQRKSTIVCLQRDPDNWKAMILNDEVSANSIMKRATKHYTIKINSR